MLLLLQMGSFVPAESASLGVVDRLFARVGSSDNVSRHQSTFHCEMTETAHVLNNATPRSLIILDEIGEGGREGRREGGIEGGREGGIEGGREGGGREEEEGGREGGRERGGREGGEREGGGGGREGRREGGMV